MERKRVYYGKLAERFSSLPPKRQAAPVVVIEAFVFMYSSTSAAIPLTASETSRRLVRRRPNPRLRKRLQETARLSPHRPPMLRTTPTFRKEAWAPSGAADNRQDGLR
jgi:hypothetical protein